MTRYYFRPSLLLFFAVSLMPIALCQETAETVKRLDYDVVDGKRNRTIPVRIYLNRVEKIQPVILFSHGLGGSRANNAYLGDYWSTGGFICVFMQHHGSDQQVWQSAPVRERLSALKEAASAKSAIDRLHDVTAVIDQLEKWNKEAVHPLRGRLDLQHIGISGHSFGAVTTLGVAGKRSALGQSFVEPRIDAFFAMSPQPGRGLSPEKSFGQIKQPVLCMTGTKDDSPVDPSTTAESRREVYRALPTGDKYELVFDDGHHFSFGDSDGFRTRGRDPDHHPVIQKISLRFWEAYLKNDSDAKTWLQSEQPRQDCKLKANDVWIWK